MKPNTLYIVPVVISNDAHEFEKEVVVQTFPPSFHNKCIKVIIATNIIETSITLPDLLVVIDSGVFKQEVYNEKLGITCHAQKFLTQAQRDQRSGRVGRTANGFAFSIKQLDAQVSNK